MKRFLPLLLLTSCMLVKGEATDPGLAKLTLSADQVVFEAGVMEARSTILYLYGSGVRYNDSHCEALLSLLRCDLGTVPANKKYVLPQKNANSARVFFQRGEPGLVPTIYEILTP